MQLLPTRAPKRALQLVALTGLAASLASAQTAQSAARSISATGTPTALFPLQASGQDAHLGAPLLASDSAGIHGLMALDSVQLTDVELPGGAVVTLDLTRVDVERRQFGFQVDGQLARSAAAGLDISVWKGSILGDDQSDVMLGFSNHGSRGWIRTRHQLVHLMPVPDATGSWELAGAVLVDESALNDQGYTFDGTCGTAPPAVAPVPSALSAGPSALTQRGMGVDTVGMRECTVAMETDWQFYQLFNDLNAATSYLTTLLTFISDRYETQTSTVLTFPYVQIYTSSNDPWATPDNGGSSIDMLNEFRSAWLGNVPMGATLGHMMSGASLGGGVAWLDVLCNPDYNFGISGNIGGDVSFPVSQGPANWDFMVVAHEMGHNFSSPHTHDFCPPLDECAPSGYFGQCQTTQQCTNMGTIMSYCHLCSGGTANITTYFHPEAAALMTAASEACNPALLEVQVTAPDLVSDVQPTETMLDVVTGSISSPTLNYRFQAGGAFTSVAMTSLGSGIYVADIPPTPCGSTVEYWMGFDAAGFGAFTAPTGAATGDYYEAIGGVEQVLFADNFENDLGWQANNLGASTGDWERGVPVNDSGWDYDPASDADGSGSCYLTENQTGNTDVDGGAVELVSPPFDMTAAGAAVQYSYFLRLTNSDGTDRLLVEADAGGGNWLEVTRHDTDGGLAWRDVRLTAADFMAAGVSPSATTRMRFTANDDGAGSIVEAGLDGFAVAYIDCGGLGVVYCDPANVNSTGNPATIGASGSDVAADNDVTLTVDSLPTNSLGYFLTSQTQGFVANPAGSSGNICLAGTVGRYAGQVLNSGAAGSVSLTLDLTQTPQPNGLVSVMAGETWNFQEWYRDAIAGIPTSNFSDAVSISFQ